MMGQTTHHWEVGDVFVDNDRKTYIIRQVDSQTSFEVLDLYDQSDHGWWVEDDTHYIGHINPNPSKGECVMIAANMGYSVRIEDHISETNQIALDLAKIK